METWKREPGAQSTGTQSVNKSVIYQIQKDRYQGVYSHLITEAELEHCASFNFMEFGY